MSKLKQRPDGTYLSCWDSIIYSEDVSRDHSDHQVYQELYLEKAIELLVDIVMEDILEREPLAEETRRDTPEDN